MDFSKLKEIRKEKGISISEISKSIGVSRGTLTSMEAGKLTISFETVELYVNYLDYQLFFMPYQKWNQSANER